MTYVHELEKRCEELEEKLASYANIGKFVHVHVYTIYESDETTVDEITISMSFFSDASRRLGYKNTACTIKNPDKKWHIYFQNDTKDTTEVVKECSYDEVIQYAMEYTGLAALGYTTSKDVKAKTDHNMLKGLLAYSDSSGSFTTYGNISITSNSQADSMSYDELGKNLVNLKKFNEIFTDEVIDNMKKFVAKSEKPVESSPWTLRSILKNLKNVVRFSKKKS
jgi:hypothetical protein